MTRKDYEAAAMAVRTVRLVATDERAADYIVRFLVRFFMADNPRFDPDRFLAACEPRPEGKP